MSDSMTSDARFEDLPVMDQVRAAEYVAAIGAPFEGSVAKALEWLLRMDKLNG